MFNAYATNTLTYDPELCTGCGMCSTVCPHAVFRMGERKVLLEFPQRCMECGACQRNCPPRAISVDSGVGCAAAWIQAAVKKQEEPDCGGCCGVDS